MSIFSLSFRTKINYFTYNSSILFFIAKRRRLLVKRYQNKPVNKQLNLNGKVNLKRKSNLSQLIERQGNVLDISSACKGVHQRENHNKTWNDILSPLCSVSCISALPARSHSMSSCMASCVVTCTALPDLFLTRVFESNASS